MTSLQPVTLLDPFLNKPHLALVPQRKEVVAPLSWEQEQIWLHSVLYPDLPIYNETAVIRYFGEVDLPALESTFEELTRRHSIWRTTIEEQDGTPHQRVGPSKPIKIEIFDLASESELRRMERIEALLFEFATRPFDLAVDPLFRIFAVRCASMDTRIFLTLHHLIFDGASLRQIVLPQLIELYNAYNSGRDFTPPPTFCLQYAAYAARQRREAPTAREAALAFWRTQLVGFSPLALPYDRPSKPETDCHGAMRTFCLDEALTTALLEMARKERATTFSVLLASFIVLLARYANAQDVTVGTTYGGRTSTELENVVGCFLNTLLLRTDLSGDPSFRELLTRVRGVTLDALENADAPFQEVVREALPRTNIGESPIQAFFSFQPPSPNLPPEWDLDVFEIFNGCAKFDLHVEIEQEQGSFRGRLMYSTALFDSITIEAMQQHWFNLIGAAIRTPGTSIWKLCMHEREQVGSSGRAAETGLVA